MNMAFQLPHLSEIERLSSRVVRVLGGNPGKFTLQGTNTYLVGTGSTRLLIDTGEGKASWLEVLASVLKSEETTVSHSVITHWHQDHTGGCSQLLQICPNAIIYEKDLPQERKQLSDGQIFKVEGATLRAFYCPGHTKNHMAFILEEEDAMFTGDNVLGHGTAVFEDLATYLKSLERMKVHFSGRAYPGHGAVIEDGPAKIEEYIKHRAEREQQVLQTLKELNGDGARPTKIVTVVYRDYPKKLYEPAAQGVRQILQKLEGEGKVTFEGEDRWKVVEQAAL